MNIAFLLRPCALRLLCPGVLALCLSDASANTVNFGSTAGALNLHADGAPLGGGFRFQLGAFSDGFVPDASNQDEWAGRWVPLSGSDGRPVASATAFYNDDLIVSQGEMKVYANSFAGVTEVATNASPFTAGAQAYIFGFDGESPASSSEWIVLRDENWKWPQIGEFSPARTFAVAESTRALAGRANDGGTGAQLVAAPARAAVQRQDFASWVAGMFPAAVVADPDLAPQFVSEDADPDSDGLSNLAEFYLGSDPLLTGARRAMSVAPAAPGADIRVSFLRSKSADGVAGTLLASGDLSDWAPPTAGAVQIEDLGDSERITVNLPSSSADATAFYRLRIERE